MFIQYYTRHQHTWISRYTNYTVYINATWCTPLLLIISDLCTDVILVTTRQAMEVNVKLRRFRAKVVAMEKCWILPILRVCL